MPNGGVNAIGATDQEYQLFAAFVGTLLYQAGQLGRADILSPLVEQHEVIVFLQSRENGIGVCFPDGTGIAVLRGWQYFPFAGKITIDPLAEVGQGSPGIGLLLFSYGK